MILDWPSGARDQHPGYLVLAAAWAWSSGTAAAPVQATFVQITAETFRAPTLASETMRAPTIGAETFKVST